MAYARQKDFEENEYYVREYQVDRRGQSRKQVEKERRTYGQPLENSFTVFPSRRLSPVVRSALDLDFSRKYEYQDSNRKSSSETVRQKHSQQQHQQNYHLPDVYTASDSASAEFQQHYSPPYIHPIKSYDRSFIHHQVQQPQLSPRKSNIVLQPIIQIRPDVHEEHPRQNPQQFPVQNSRHESTATLYSQPRAGSPQILTGAGDIENTDAGFTIQLNVEHFEPKDIKVTLSGNVLSVVGERIDQDKSHEQTLKRSFSRKYCIPDDIKMNSIKSFVSESGTLVIKGSRKSWKETEIDIQIEPPQSRNLGSSIASPKSTQPSPAGSSKSKASLKSSFNNASTKRSTEE